MHLLVWGLVTRGMSELDICFVAHEMGLCLQVGLNGGFGGDTPLHFRRCKASINGGFFYNTQI